MRLGFRISSFRLWALGLAGALDLEVSYMSLIRVLVLGFEVWGLGLRVLRFEIAAWRVLLFLVAE